MWLYRAAVLWLVQAQAGPRAGMLLKLYPTSQSHLPAGWLAGWHYTRLSRNVITGLLSSALCCCSSGHSCARPAPAARPLTCCRITACCLQPGAMPLDQRARQIFAYFQKYNYEVRGATE